MIPGSANALLLATAAAEGGYQIERSLRFNSSDSAYLSRTPASAGNRKTWTWAGWVKNTSSTTTTYPATLLFARNGAGAGVGEYFWLAINNVFTANGHQLAAGDGNVNYLVSTAFYRDPSAWYHIVCAYDSTQATASSRLRLYVNGVEVTAFNTDNRVSITQNSDGVINRSTIEHRMGLHASAYSNCYLADIHLIDGQALDPTSFTEVDATTGQLIPKAYTGSYGTNGFHLPFSDNSTAAALGTDTSGNGNTWTVNNISVAAGSGNDSLVDSPTNYGDDTGVGGEVRGNYCTFNPLDLGNAGTASWILANGNLDASDPSNCYGVVPGTIGVSSGKYYWELTFAGGSIGSTDYWGIERCDNTGRTRRPGNYENAYWFRADGNKVSGTGAASSYGSSFALTDVAGIAFDADNGTLTFYRNGTSMGTAFTGISASLPWRLVIGNAANATSITTWTLNAGQRPFAYTAPSGFKALCTQNLDDPLVAKPSEVMDVVTYTGNGSTQTISGLGFSPDLVWIKSRNAAVSHVLQDTVRGVSTYLASDLTASEAVYSNLGITAFNSDGFTVADINNGGYRVNGAPATTYGGTYVAWTWDAGSSTVTNTQGSITSQVRANASAGFSIVSYTFNSSGTVGHGLGVAPEFIIVKARGLSTQWFVYHRSLGTSKYIRLSFSGGAVTFADAWNPVNSTVFRMEAGLHSIGSSYIAYCFAPVNSYSAFGTYTGNGSTDGPFVFTGMRPRWLLIKRTDTTDSWFLQDSARDTYNPCPLALQTDTANSEYNYKTTFPNDMLSNGFKLRTTNGAWNASGGTYIYAAFAENPFQYARAR